VRIPHHQPTDTVGVGIGQRAMARGRLPPRWGWWRPPPRDATLIGVFAAEFGAGEVAWSAAEARLGRNVASDSPLPDTRVESP
jgi:hypothetical protein